MDIVLIAAIGEKNNVIGNKGALPWKPIKEDWQDFRRETLYWPVIIGRKTFDSLLSMRKAPLDKRTNIVVSSSPELVIPHGIVYHSFSVDEALQTASFFGSRVYVIGGQQMYEQTIEKAKNLKITEIKGDYAGDAFFPVIDSRIWKREVLGETEMCRFVRYNRIER